MPGQKAGHFAYNRPIMSTRERADRLLVTRGLFETRTRAKAAINAGLVTADGVRVRKASEEISLSADISAEAEHPYVSRGGIKLTAALDHFSLDVRGRICLDVGSSTGGFSEVLILRGARRVYAVDVGREQLHARLRNRDDIVSIEQTDIRVLDFSQLVEKPDFAVIDVSFISLKLVLPAVGQLLAPHATLIALIKPQFEASRGAIRKGIVRDETVHTAVRDDISRHLTALKWHVGGVIPSPIKGGDGNLEFLIEAERG
jgi:23S rRNA (cytidine1920-2'-O)/16S rRNA (cytidine1409-2'-O)-methyltransferase